MQDAARELGRALFEAMKAERDGHTFYQMAARSCADERAREVFLLLAAEELDHERFLAAQHRAVLQTGRIDETLRLGPRSELAGASPIFSAEIRGRIAEAHVEMSALSIGLQLEQSAVTYYREQARRATEPSVRRLFEELERWESGHYEALLRQQEALRDDYWSAGGFSPF